MSKKTKYLAYQKRRGFVKEVDGMQHAPSKNTPGRIDVYTADDKLHCQYDLTGIYTRLFQEQPSLAWADLRTIRAWLDDPTLNPSWQMHQWLED